MKYTAEDVYESFQDPASCKALIRMLLNSGMLPDIMDECNQYAQDTVWLEAEPNEDENVIIGRLPRACKTLIRDDDAATTGAPHWWASTLRHEEAETEYGHSGTVSWSCSI